MRAPATWRRFNSAIRIVLAASMVVGGLVAAGAPAGAAPPVGSRDPMTTPLTDWTPPDDFTPASVGVAKTSGLQLAPDPGDLCTLRSCIVALALAEAANSSHNREGSGNNNCNFYSGWWGNSGVVANCLMGSGIQWRQNAWCADFARYIWNQYTYLGAKVTGLDPWAGSFYRATEGTSRWKPKSSGYSPQPGDAVVYDWDSPHNGGSDGWGIDHVGIVISVFKIRLADGTFTDGISTIEGNTTASGDGPQGVYQRNRYTTDVVGYVTPN